MKNDFKSICKRSLILNIITDIVIAIPTCHLFWQVIFYHALVIPFIASIILNIILLRKFKYNGKLLPLKITVYVLLNTIFSIVASIGYTYLICSITGIWP